MDILPPLDSKRARRLKILALLLVVPVLGFIFSFFQIRTYLTDSLVSRREIIAQLIAQGVEDRLESLIHHGELFAEMEKVRSLADNQNWNEIIDFLNSINVFSPLNVDRVFVTDPSGTLLAATSNSGDVIGKNFAFRSWYIGVTQTRKPFVSEVYKRTAEPKLNVVTIAVPVKSLSNPSNHAGYIGIQLYLENFASWKTKSDLGKNGFYYIVDQKGQVVLHPKFPVEGSVADLSDAPAVRKLISGQSGIDTFYNPIEDELRLTAYAAVKPFGWGVIVQEPLSEAFDSFYTILLYLAGIYTLLIIVNTILVFRYAERHANSDNSDGPSLT